MERPSEERHVAADRLSAGQTADGLVYHSLEDGDGQIFSGGSLIDKGLDIRFGEHAASGGYGVYHLIVFRIFVET